MGDTETKLDRFELFANAVKDYAFIQFDARNRVTHWNAGAERILGYSEAEVIGESGAIFFTPEDRAAGAHLAELETALRHGRAEDERWHVRKDGSLFRASGVMTPLYNDNREVFGFAKVLRDVTEREQDRRRLERAVQEKDALLREVHHRVKNNLQVIVSLISLQARHVADTHASEMLTETQNRVRAIARIHETLYGSVDLSMVHFGRYLTQLVADLIAFYGVDHRISARVSAADVTVDIERAIPLALITNELVCNALKHGFPGDRSGHLAVSLSVSDKMGRLRISDDGVGLPQEFRPETAESMGFHLVNILSTQLQAEVESASAGGTVVAITFPITPE
jgi:PAS domain S-box-containing protein